jgi:hypothetical protein
MATNTIPPTSTEEYELDLCDGHRKSSILRKSKQQTCTNNESQEDILRDESSKGIAGEDEVTITDARPFSQKGSLGSDRSNIPPASRTEF